MSILRNVTLLDPASEFHQQRVTARLLDGRLLDAAPTLETFGDEPTTDATGRYLARGFIDVGTTIGDPGYEHREDLESAAAAARRGGYAALLPFPNTRPAVDNKAAVRYLRRAAADLSVTIYPIGALTDGTRGTDLTEMMDLHHAGAVAFSDGHRPVQDDGLMLRCLQYVCAFGGIVLNRPHRDALAFGGQMHEGEISTMLGVKGIPALAEEMLLHRDLELLRYTDSRLHLHNVSTAKGVAMIRAAKRDGLNVTASVAALNLLFTDHDLLGFETNLKVLPPLRPAEHVAALREGLRDGTLDVVTSNHVPWEDEHKDLEFLHADFGATGLETAFSTALAALHDTLELADLVAKFNRGPALAFGLEPPDQWVLIDPRAHWTYAHTESKGRNSPFLGKTLVGTVDFVHGANFSPPVR